MTDSAKAYRCPSCGAPKRQSGLCKCDWCGTLSFMRYSTDDGKSQAQHGLPNFYDTDVLSDVKERMMAMTYREYANARADVEEIKRRLNFGKEVYV